MPSKCQLCEVNRALFAAAIGSDRKQVCSSRCLQKLIGSDVKFIGDDIFDALPDEKVLEIFQHADTEDLASLRQTSRRFRNVASDRQLLIHHFRKTITTEPIEAGTLTLRWIKANDQYRLGIALDADMPVTGSTLRDGRVYFPDAAVQFGNIQTVDLILDRMLHGEVEWFHPVTGMTLLAKAVQESRPTIVQHLIEQRKASVDQAWQGRSILDLFVNREVFQDNVQSDRQVLRLLLSRGADPDAPSQGTFGHPSTGTVRAQAIDRLTGIRRDMFDREQLQLIRDAPKLVKKTSAAVAK